MNWGHFKDPVSHMCLAGCGSVLRLCVNICLESVSVSVSVSDISWVRYSIPIGICIMGTENLPPTHYISLTETETDTDSRCFRNQLASFTQDVTRLNPSTVMTKFRVTEFDENNENI